MAVLNLDNLKKYKYYDYNITKKILIDFETKVVRLYEAGKINSPVHLSGNNEIELIEIFEYVHPNDWILSTWRSHYHALLHGIPQEKILNKILNNKSMSIIDIEHNFYTSSIVGGIIPIGIGIAMTIKNMNLNNKVWIFIGDMAYEMGIFYEAYKYSKNFKLPVQFVVEDNGMAVNSPTDIVWNITDKQIPNDIIYYKYDRLYPHHGIGKWISF